MKFKTLIYEEIAHKVVKVTFNRPKVLNALNSQMLNELKQLIDNLEDLKCLIFTGSGKSFIAGADIDEMKDFNSFQGKKFSSLGNEVFRKIEKLPFPVIAMINGFALGGGCELAMSCDILIASNNAKFGQPEVGLGITPGFGGTQRLSRIIGSLKAKELIFSGAIITAEEAEKIGLINRAIESEKLEEEINKLTAKICKNSSKAVSASKEAIDCGLQTDIDSGIKIEQNLFGLCFSSKEQKEGMLAFLEKRKPDFN